MLDEYLLPEHAAGARVQALRAAAGTPYEEQIHSVLEEEL